MADRHEQRVLRLRQLECWLPLAQAVSDAEGWPSDGAVLETLVIAALPDLMQACSSDEARAILRHVHAWLQDTRA